MHFHYVLSMGAVFALFAGFYFWTPKIIGLTYNEFLGKIHFWCMFCGVKFIFQPNTLNFWGYLFYEKYYSSNHELRNYSTSSNDTLDPWFITGFTDAEGCFSFSLLNSKNNWKLVFRFHIGLHKKDLIILEAIKAEFKAGKIYIQKTRNHAYFVVQSIETLKNIIIPYFEKYPLKTQKQADFLLFKEAIEIYTQNRPLNSNILDKILGIKSVLNKGLSSGILEKYHNLSDHVRPLVAEPLNFNPNWIQGFTEGEGSFLINKTEKKF